MATLPRTAIIEAVRSAVEPLPFVEALVEGGAAAWGRVDAWSDVDLNVFISGEAFDETFRAIEDALRARSAIQHTFVAHGPSEGGMQQKFYRLENAGPFLLVDLAVMNAATKEKFLEPELHGQNLVYFDKTGVATAPPFDRAAFEGKMRERLARLRDQTEMFHVFVEKEVSRGNFIEAFDNYRAYVAAPLLEVLRMTHGPLHHTFRTRYVHYELPPEAVARFQHLLFVRDADDLRRKYPEALGWFREVAAALA
ncbi:MAG TPA: hypothetical protein VGR51_08205 [Thermoplasmata archaeon]|jgi:hypothetical protein|nr:hypothetical protein [Thermoplasmata archaeon]